MRTHRRLSWFRLLILLSICCLAAGLSQILSADDADGGQAEWIDTPPGHLKVRVYRSEHIRADPVLILVLHGDLPIPRPAYQYEFARIVAKMTENVVAVGLLRPGYADSSGDRSAGDMGHATGDNYTPQVVDAVALAVERLKGETSARAVIIVGHSGGAAISADLLGRYPGLVDGALLVSCDCGDLAAWRASMKAKMPSPIWDLPNPSLSPLDLAGQVTPRTRVRMVVGAVDDTVPPSNSQNYADALAARKVDVKLVVVSGRGHNDVFWATQVFSELEQLIVGYRDSVKSE